MSDAVAASGERGGVFATAAGLVRTFNRLAAAVPASLPLALLRIAAAIPFLRSGLKKWDGLLQLNDTAVLLFREEFRLHVLGNAYPFPAPALTAFLAGCAEVALPILLIAGLGTRFAALGLLVMTGIIQLTVPGGWANFHLPWAAMLFALLVFGPGRLSIDQVLFKARL